jgi:hypothetical protein
MTNDDRKPPALNMEDVFDNDQYDDEHENVAQSTIAEEPSIILPSLPPLPTSLTQSTSAAGNVAHSTSALTQLVTLVAGNVAQSTSTFFRTSSEELVCSFLGRITSLLLEC